MAEQISPPGPALPKIRGTQVGLSNPGQIDAIKSDMRAGRYAYHEERGRIAGVRDPKGVYHVKVGHHRMAAAMEIYRETRNPTPVLELLRWGRWDSVAHPPLDSRPLPARHWWGALRNWLNL
jgi:hypothetical protein